SVMPEYSTGISQPPNSTMRAPLARCLALRGVFFRGPGVLEDMVWMPVLCNHCRADERPTTYYRDPEPSRLRDGPAGEQPADPPNVRTCGAVARPGGSR